MQGMQELQGRQDLSSFAKAGSSSECTSHSSTNLDLSDILGSFHFIPPRALPEATAPKLDSTAARCDGEHEL